MERYDVITKHDLYVPEGFENVPTSAKSIYEIFECFE